MNSDIKEHDEHVIPHGLSSAESASFNDLLAKFPSHKAGLSLEHNQHKNYYDKAEAWIADNDWCDWENEAAKQKAIDTDEIWTLQWYPETPVGFCAIAAPTLADLFRLISTDS